MNRLALARQALTAGLVDVVDGRVYAYPPPRGRAVAPSAWVDVPTVSRDTIGQATKVIVATFPVWVVHDGAVHAAVAGLDDIVSQVWDACERMIRTTPQVARPQDYQRADGTVWQAVVLSVDVALTAVTLCLPDVEPAVIPPIPLTEEAPVG